MTLREILNAPARDFPAFVSIVAFLAAVAVVCILMGA